MRASILAGRPAGAGTMRAAVLASPGEVRLEEVAVPTPAEGEVRIKLTGSGVCASNLALWDGAPWFDYPLRPGAPGHEGWGVVDACGAGVSAPREGDRVTGLSGHAYAEYDLAPADQLAVLPPSLGDTPFPGEPIGCAFNIFRRSRIEPGQTVAIIGIGFLGALLTSLAAGAGARVVALSRRKTGLELAAARGATDLVRMDDHERVLESVADLTDGRLCDRVIECAGKQWPLDLAGSLTRERGTLVIAGYHQDGPRQVDMQLWNWRGLDVVNAHERDPVVYLEGIREGIGAVADGRLEVASLFTHTFALEHLDHALNTARDRPEGFVKALVTP